MKYFMFLLIPFVIFVQYTQYINDTFTDSNGTAIESHVMDLGPGWTNRAFLGGGGGSGEIQSNELDVTSTNSMFTFPAIGATGVFVVDARVSSGTGWQVGHVVRWSNSSNYVVGEIINTAGGKIRIYRVVNGSPTGISEKSYSVANGTDYTMTFTVTGSNVKLKVDDGVTVDSLLKAESFNNIHTIHGLVSNTLTAFFDDYSAEVTNSGLDVRRRGLRR